MIDLWILRVIKYLGNITGDVLNIKIEKFIKQIKYIKKLSDEVYINNFIGKYIDLVNAKKILTSQGKKFIPYYPALSKGKYRSIKN